MEARDFVPIRVSTLRGDTKINFDAFVHVAGKHILYCKTGDSFEGSRLQKFKEKKIKKLYILTEHEEKYREYMTKNIEMAYDKNSGKSLDSRSEIIQGAQQAATEEVMDNPEDSVAYDLAKIGSEKYVNFILDEKEAMQAIMNIKNTDQSIAHHGVTVAAIAVAMAEKQNLHETEKLELLSLGCLLHDIEHTHTGLKVGRPVKEFTTDELRLYKKHPADALERLKKHKHFDPVVLDIIYNHEETIDGNGFPNKKKEKELSPLCQIASVSNSYDRLMSFEGVADQKEALKKLLVDKMGLHSLKNLQTLQNVLKERSVV